MSAGSATPNRARQQFGQSSRPFNAASTARATVCVRAFPELGWLRGGACRYFSHEQIDAAHSDFSRCDIEAHRSPGGVRRAMADLPGDPIPVYRFGWISTHRLNGIQRPVVSFAMVWRNQR